MKQMIRENRQLKSVAELVERTRKPATSEEIARRRQASMRIRAFRETLGTIDLSSEDLLREEDAD